MLFKLKIWDKKTIDIFEDGELIQVPHPTDTGWYKKNCRIETDQVRITGFQDYDIYADETKSKSCTQVFFSDGEYVYAAYPLDKFEDIYIKEYMPLIPKDLGDIINDLQGGEPSA